MKINTKSSKFVFVLNNNDTLKNVDHLKMIDYHKFSSSNQIGLNIQQAAKDDNWEKIDMITNQNSNVLPFLKLQIQDAFLSALNLRNINTVQYFLQNGFEINSVAEDAALTACYALEYLKQEDGPLDLLKLVLKYGASARIASDRQSSTPLHLAAQYGSISFVNILLDHGADINAVNDDRQTPLAIAIKYKKSKVIDLLKDKGGKQKWNF